MIVKKSRKGQRKGQTQKKSPETLEVSGLSMAAGEGFEPSHTESESAVLPLHKPAMLSAALATNRYYYTEISDIVNRVFKFFSFFTILP